MRPSIRAAVGARPRSGTKSSGRRPEEHDRGHSPTAAVGHRARRSPSLTGPMTCRTPHSRVASSDLRSDGERPGTPNLPRSLAQEPTAAAKRCSIERATADSGTRLVVVTRCRISCVCAPGDGPRPSCDIHEMSRGPVTRCVCHLCQAEWNCTITDAIPPSAWCPETPEPRTSRGSDAGGPSRSGPQPRVLSRCTIPPTTLAGWPVGPLPAWPWPPTTDI